MLQGWFIVVVALAYIGFLFLVASYGDRSRKRVRGSRARLLIYPLSLAIYCTSWTFFGSVGVAARTGFDFLTIYIGPVLMVGLAYPLIIRIVRLAKGQNITSIADFIAARYGKSQAVAATVALIAIVGMIPYIAAAAQSWCRRRSAPSSPMAHRGRRRRGAAAPWRHRAVRRFADGGLRGAVRHAPRRRHRASGRPYARYRDGINHQACGLPRRRHLRHLRHVPRAGGFVHACARRSSYRVGLDPRAVGHDLLGYYGVIAVRDRAAAPAISCRRGGEQERIREPRCAFVFPLNHNLLINLFSDADRHGGIADIPARPHRWRHVRFGAFAALCVFRIVHADRFCRRPVGGDRDGDRRIGRARHHGLERHRHAAHPQPPRYRGRRARRCHGAQLS